MRTPLSRAAAGVFLAMLLAWLALPMATASAATAKNVSNAEEAWFLENKEPLAGLPEGDPSCEAPTGCNVSGSAQRPNPHPEGVLVVAANAGAPDAQTFFTFDIQNLPLGAMVTGGKVTLPVARDPDARNANAANAKMVACLTTGFVPSGTDGGSYKDRPTFDEKICVPVKQEKPDPELTFSVDLERFGKSWSGGAINNGITLMVDPAITAPAPNETWRVAFNSSRRAQQETEKQKANPEASRIEFPAIVSTLEYKVEKMPDLFGSGGFETGGDTGTGTGSTDFSDSGTGSVSTDTGTSGGFGSSGTPATGTGSVTTGTGTASTPVTPPVAAGNSGQVAAGGAVPTAANPPGMSPAVWITPVLALAAAAAMAWSLMQPVELAGQREGAVSRLMRTRRLKTAAPTNPS